MTRRDLTTLPGVPELPAGMFYRLWYQGLGFYKMAVRERRRFGSRELAAVTVWPSDAAGDGEDSVTAEDLLVHAAKRAADKMRANHRTYLAHRALTAFEGDHPRDPEETE